MLQAEPESGDVAASAGRVHGGIWTRAKPGHGKRDQTKGREAERLITHIDFSL